MNLVLKQYIYFFRKHALAIGIAAIISFCMVLPSVWLRHELGDAFQGIYIADIDNDIYYYARIKAAYEGNYKITRATMWIEDAENLPYTAPPLGENIVALTARLLGVEPHQMILVGNALFSALLAVILSGLFWTLTRSKIIAALVPLAVMLASNVFFDPRNIMQVLANAPEIKPNVYNRPVHPQISSLIFFGWAWVMAIVVRNRMNGQQAKLPILCAGLLFGSMAYIYPYAVAYAGAFLGLLACVAWWRVRFRRIEGKEREAYRRLGAAAGAILIIGILVTFPYWINYYHFYQHELFETMRMRFVLFHSRTPIFSAFIALSLAALFTVKKKLSPESWLYLVAFSGAGVLVLNQQVLSGMRLFPGHWHWYYVVPISAAGLITSLFFLLKKWPRVALIAACAIASFAVLDGVRAQYAYYSSAMKQYAYFQNYVPVYEWLDEHAPAGSVVLSDPEFSERLPLWTKHYRYLFRPTDELFLIPTQQIKDAFFTRLFLEGKNPDDAHIFIQQETPELREILNGYYRRYAYTCSGNCYHEAELQALRDEYRAFVESNFEDNVKKYKIDFAVWDTLRYPDYRFDQFDSFDIIAEQGNFKIYRVVPVEHSF